MEKVTICATCGGQVDQPDTGRPRVYCDVTCRRVAEYRIRRVMALLSTAEKAEQRARLELVDPVYRTSPRSGGVQKAGMVPLLCAGCRVSLGVLSHWNIMCLAS